MSDVDLDALRELLAKATPGPWRVRDNDYFQGIVTNTEPIILQATFDREDRAHLTKPDADLIVAAVNALPALLDLVSRQEAALRWLESVYEPAIGEWPESVGSLLPREPK